MRKTAVMQYAFLFSLLALTTFVLLEIGVRLFLHVPPAVGGFFTPHDEAIFTVGPNASTTLTIKNNEEVVITNVLATSSQGIRDREYGPKSDTEFRIVMLGDSFTMGHGLEQSETISSVLEELLKQEHLNHEIQVLNCGVSGYAQWQERIFLKERCFAFEPDLVILQLFPSNDVAGSYNKVGKYLQTLNEGWERFVVDFRHLHELPHRTERICQKYSSTYRLLNAMLKSRGIAFHLVSSCRVYASRLHPPPIYPNVVSQSDRPFENEVCLQEWYPEMHEAWAIYADSIRGIRDDCQEKEVDFIGYVFGDMTSLRPNRWKNLSERFPDTPYEKDKDVRLTVELLEDLNIPYVNVQPTLLNYHIEDVFYIYDGHFTPKGAEVVATSLRDYLMENYFGKQ